MAFNSEIKGYMTFGKSFSRGGAFPLEAYEIWTDYDALVAYAANTNPDKDPSYIGQKVAYVDIANNKVTHYGIEIDGSLKELGATPIGDEKSIVVDETNYTISLKGVDGLVFERVVLGEDGEPTGEKEEVQFQPLMTKDGLVWVEPSKTTVEGLATLIDALTARVKALEDDRVTEQELADAIKDFATDEEVASAVSTAVATEKERAEAAEKALGERIDAIDFVDETELATALEPYAKTAEVNKTLEDYAKTADVNKTLEDYATTEAVNTKLADYNTAAEVDTKLAAYDTTEVVDGKLANKADKAALEELASTVDAFLTGDGTEAALDSLKELIAYIETHDDTDIAGILEAIQAIENKLVGIDTTVTAYVTNALETLINGDIKDLKEGLEALENELDAYKQEVESTYATKDEVSDSVEALNGRINNLDGEVLNLGADIQEHLWYFDEKIKSELFDSSIDEDENETLTRKFATIGEVEEVADNIEGYKQEVESTYVTKDEFGTFVEEVEAHKQEAESTYATKDELGEVADELGGFKQEVAGTYVTKEAYNTNNQTIANTYATKEYVGTFTTGEDNYKDITTIVGYVNKKAEETLAAAQGGSSETAASVKLQLDNYKTENDAKVQQNINDITALQGQLGNTNTNVSSNTTEIGKINTEITTNIKPAIEALEGADVVIEETLAGHTAAIKTINETTIPALQGVVNTKAAQSDVDAINTKIGPVTDGKTIVDMINEVAGTIDFTPYAKKDDVAATYATKDELAAETDRADKAEKANAQAIADLTNGAIKKNTDDIAAINALLNTVDSEDTITSLKELAIWVEAHDTEVLPVITQQGKDIESLTGRVGAVETAVNTTLPGAIAQALVDAKAYTDEKMVKADGTSIINNAGTFSVGTVSTDNLVQGTMTLVLNGGNSEVED